jgi:hypothetical protein
MQKIHPSWPAKLDDRHNYLAFGEQVLDDMHERLEEDNEQLYRGEEEL